MQQAKINGFQLFCVIFLFELGSAILLGMAGEAKQDAWITILLGIVSGCVLYLIFSKLNNMFPSLPLTSYIPKILGRYVGTLFALLYVVYFMYIASRVLRDFEELLVITAYRSSSLLTIGIIMVLCVMYAAYKGILVFFRFSELCLFIILFILVFLVIFELASGIIRFKHLQPLLENGWHPVFKSFFPTTLTFPFGEMVTFTMLLPFLNKQEKARKVGIIGVCISGGVLLLFTLLNILIAGADITSRSAFPILTAVGYINIADFVQRLDTVVIITMVILGFVKITVFFFCAIMGAADVFKLKQSQKLIYPMGVIVLITSRIIASNYIEHLDEGLHFVPYYLHLPFQIIIPSVLLVIAMIKQKFTPQT
ncbi:MULTISPECIES: GerAB/ArcD/ProY family transporter [unclassified Bacillus (in: firmicutes)]|uniref:GerAB/ArcD/ProY family transporter n=1 Tax=unclassified Bacillus (in: firmicutes) TaxID=185979 RepID=UPI001596BBE5|nr:MULTISPECIES: GerAB/ArcD/ProY family transporter [unclassified Bacillus (in: firmicutes)]